MFRRDDSNYILRCVLVCCFTATLAAAQNASSQKTPQVAASTAALFDSTNLPAQSLGVDDLIGVSVYDAPELTRSVRIGADGAVILPMLQKRVKVSGMFPEAAERAISAELKQEGILVDPLVTVTVVEYRSRPITVAGAVKQPITFQAMQSVRLLDAISQAGGLSDSAGSEVLITRNRKVGGQNTSTVQTVSVSRLLNSSDPEANVELHGGEEVRVPDSGKFYVLGNVKTPGGYPLKDPHDATDCTVLKALAVSQGLLPFNTSVAYIYRKAGDAGGAREIPIPLKLIMERKAPDVNLQANDIFYVPENTGRRLTFEALGKVGGVAATTASGMLIWRR
jgi:polysaccharide export outer membrane protein